MPESPNTGGCSWSVFCLSAQRIKKRRIRTDKTVIATLDDPWDGDLNTAKQDVKAVGEEHYRNVSVFNIAIDRKTRDTDEVK